MKPKQHTILLLTFLLLSATIACRREDATPTPTSRAVAILEGRQSGTVVVLPSFTPPAEATNSLPATPTAANAYPIAVDTTVPATPSPIVVNVPTAELEPTPTSITEILVIPTPTTNLLISPTPTTSTNGYPLPQELTPTTVIIQQPTSLPPTSTPVILGLLTQTPRPTTTPLLLPTSTQALSGYPNPIISIVTATPLVQPVGTQQSAVSSPSPSPATTTPNQTTSTATQTPATLATATRLLASPTTTSAPTDTPAPTETAEATQTPIPVIVPTITATRPPLIGNQLVNGSFEGEVFFHNEDDSMAVPTGWTFDFVEGTNPLATDDDNAFKQPNVEVLTLANLSPEEQPFVLNGQQVVKVSKQFQTFNFSLTQPVALPPGGYILKVNVFPDLILNYSDSNRPQEPNSAQMSFLLDNTQLPWQNVTVGQQNALEVRFDLLSETTVTVGAAFRGRWAVTENSWYLDNWSLTAVNTAE